MSAVPTRAPAESVLLLADLDPYELRELLAAYGAVLVRAPAAATIPGSYWGDAEAGLIGKAVHVRADTPAHSFLHELCHFVCMDAARRTALATDAGGSDDEECGVCYLQVLLAERFRSFGAARCLADMDAWGYSFREGGAAAWLEGDGVHARAWLLAHGLFDAAGRPTLRLRT
jgi:hypothetical protein